MAACLSLTLFTGCISTFSELQGARVLGKGRFEVTPSYTATDWRAKDDHDEIDDRIGIQTAFGVSDDVDWRVRYERVEPSSFDGFNVVAAGPKFYLSESRLGDIVLRTALYTPIGFAFGSGLDVGDTVEFHPTSLASLELDHRIEINGSAKVLIRKGDEFIAFNVGASLGHDLDRLVLRPEIGILLNPGEDGYYTHFSVGASYMFGH